MLALCDPGDTVVLFRPYFFNHLMALQMNGINVEFIDCEMENGWLLGEGDVQVQVMEHGLQFRVDVAGGQKTGFFLDQRENRRLL